MLTHDQEVHMTQRFLDLYLALVIMDVMSLIPTSTEKHLTPH
ncbi:hypothetical protein D019_2394 [Vibrio parahaemolyticus VP2007-095]|nr:hypothetical protein D019_2394 [Vibrio parahaemolyticus VP2007-095]